MPHRYCCGMAGAGSCQMAPDCREHFRPELQEGGWRDHSKLHADRSPRLHEHG